MVVSRDLQRCVVVDHLASTLNKHSIIGKKWKGRYKRSPKLLNAGQLTHTVPFAEHHCASPLPRAFQWADGSAYVNHVQLVRRARGAELPESFWTDPLMYQGDRTVFWGHTNLSHLLIPNGD
ncbi:hypothetical protein ACT691_08915 [Vibrio metschnikovii]